MMKGLLIGVSIFIGAIVLSLLVSLFAGGLKTNIDGDLASYFEERITQEALSRVGQPIEGFNAFLLQSAFPGLKREDFDNVSSLEGVYRISGDGMLVYQRTKNQPITSAEEMITTEGYGQLLLNLLLRFDLAPADMIAVERILILIREKDIFQELSFGYLNNNYVVRHSGEWYPAATNPAVIFTRNQFFAPPDTSDLSGFSPYIIITSQKEVEDYPPFTDISATALSIKGIPFTRVVSLEGDGEGETLRYVYSRGDRHIVLTHYPYDLETSATAMFEKMMQTFTPVK